MDEQLIPINILIGDRTYRIKSLSKDEEIIRKTLKIINDKIIEFKTQFAGKDMQDYIAMVFARVSAGGATIRLAISRIEWLVLNPYQPARFFLLSVSAIPPPAQSQA